MPAFAEFCYKIQPYLITFMVIIHLSEATHMAITRLAKHTVPMFSQLWWKWIFSDCIEGFTALIRFDEVVNEERVKKESQKH